MNKLVLVDQQKDIDILLNVVFEKFGYDFRNYSRTHISRRVRHRLVLSESIDVAHLIDKIISNRVFSQEIISDFSITVTEFFRDAKFFLKLRTSLLPLFKHNRELKIWHIGCASGEEAYSISILLHELELLEKARIYATDMNDDILRTAELGKFRKSWIESFETSYIESGGKNNFFNYFDHRRGTVSIKPFLKNNVVFAKHNIVQDASIGSFDIIFCRNVLIYFNKDLQNLVLKKITTSLKPKAFLCLGSKESLQFSDSFYNFSTFMHNERIYQRHM